MLVNIEHMIITHEVTSSNLHMTVVWLLRRHISTTRPCVKLDYKKLGPFRIIECINFVAFWLALPSHFRIHDVFYVSLLEPHYASQLPGRQAPPTPPPPVQLTTWEEYELEQILDSRSHHWHLQYLVLWRGYPMSEATWEPSKNLRDDVTLRTLDTTMLVLWFNQYIWYIVMYIIGLLLFH